MEVLRDCVQQCTASFVNVMMEGRKKKGGGEGSVMES